MSATLDAIPLELLEEAAAAAEVAAPHTVLSEAATAAAAAAASAAPPPTAAAAAHWLATANVLGAARTFFAVLLVLVALVMVTRAVRRGFSERTKKFR